MKYVNTFIIGYLDEDYFLECGYKVNVINKSRYFNGTRTQGNPVEISPNHLGIRVILSDHNITGVDEDVLVVILAAHLGVKKGSFALYDAPKEKAKEFALENDGVAYVLFESSLRSMLVEQVEFTKIDS